MDAPSLIPQGRRVEQREKMRVRVLWGVGAKDFLMHLGIAIYVNDILDVQ